MLGWRGGAGVVGDCGVAGAWLQANVVPRGGVVAGMRGVWLRRLGGRMQTWLMTEKR